jgi:hypothetical protein
MVLASGDAALGGQRAEIHVFQTGRGRLESFARRLVRHYVDECLTA